jgi:DNA adenine methylase
MNTSTIKSPYPWFGGKSRVAKIIWSGFGELTNYVEPFAGSLAVMLANPKIPKIETINDKDCFLCIDPNTKILMKDLTWKMAGELKIGDDLLGFDEENNSIKYSKLRAPSKYRKWRCSKVLAVPRVILPCYKLTFDDGTSVIASENHSWLVGSHCTGKGGRGWRWVITKNLIANRKNQRSWILKLASVIEKENSYDAGWLGGFLDGEGHIRKSTGAAISISQNPGIASNNLEKLLLKYDFDFSIRKQKKCWRFEIKGGIKEQLRLLMLVRPERLINNFINRIENVSIYGRQHGAVSLVSKEYLGEREVVALSTTTRTFVAEGLASHNCNFWRAVSNDPDGVAKFADYPVNEIDLHARQRWLTSTATQEFKNKLEEDSDFYDIKAAGYWVWGVGASVGNNWLNSKGLNSAPLLSSAGGGIHGLTHNILDWFKQLQSRTRRTRVCCGDWSRVVTPSVTYNNKGLGPKDITGIFLDPPYDISNRDKVYNEDSNIFSDVCKWAIENGDNPKLRIILCGYDGDHNIPNNWKVYSWQANGGMANLGNDRGKANRDNERIWFSPYCLY